MVDPAKWRGSPSHCCPNWACTVRIVVDRLLPSAAASKRTIRLAVVVEHPEAVVVGSGELLVEDELVELELLLVGTARTA